MLTEDDKIFITNTLKKMNRFIWTDAIVLKVIENVENIKSGKISPNDYFVPKVMTWNDYLFQLNLSKFLPNGTN